MYFVFLTEHFEELYSVVALQPFDEHITAITKKYVENPASYLNWCVAYPEQTYTYFEMETYLKHKINMFKPHSENESNIMVIITSSPAVFQLCKLFAFDGTIPTEECVYGLYCDKGNIDGYMREFGQFRAFPKNEAYQLLWRDMDITGRLLRAIGTLRKR